MWINSPKELGHLIRDRRRRLGWSQAALARRVGATRHWVIALERGNATAEVDRVLKALFALGFRMNVTEPPQGAVDGGSAESASRELLSRTASGSVRRLSGTPTAPSGPAAPAKAGGDEE